MDGLIGATKSVAVHMIGKVKTTVQMVAIPFLLFDGVLFGVINTHVWGTWLIWISAILTVWSMIYYLQKAIPEIRRAPNSSAAGFAVLRLSSLSSSSSSPGALIRAMPAVFVLIWSTGFIVAKYGLPYAPPLTFLAIRYFLSIVCFLVWIVLARAAWPQSRQQWLHLAVTGVLMHAAYLGGVWVAVKAGMGSGLTALVVGLQPVLTALWVSWIAQAGEGEEGAKVSKRQWAGLALGLGGCCWWCRANSARARRSRR
jgi:hypothetical protein